MVAAELRGALSSAAVSPYDELMAYEYLYSQEGATLKAVTALTSGVGRLPTQALADQVTLFEDPRDTEAFRKVESYVSGKIGGFDLAINGTPSWPASLADSERPAPILYFRGSLSLMGVRSFSVVGSRKASETGKAAAIELAREFVLNGKAVVTGLAAGIDTAATKSALRKSEGLVIGVIGTPIDEYYPRENRGLTEAIVDEGGLVVSQVPLYRYHTQPFETKRYYFPERNELMAAISDATVIVEASDTSGTLTQARACAHQGRPLFILRSCAEEPSVSWPAKWAKRENVFVVDDAGDILDIMESRGLYRDRNE